MKSEDRRLLRRLSRESTSGGAPGQAPSEMRRIGFVGFSAGAGATTLAHAAAEHLARRRHAEGRRTGKTGGTNGSESGRRGRAGFVTVLELSCGDAAPAGFPFDKIGADRHFAGREFLSFYRLAKDGKSPAGAFNISGGVNWALRVPGERDADPGVSGLIRLCDNIGGDPVLCDISVHHGGSPERRSDAREILADMHRVICVIDPLPSRLLAGAATMDLVRAAEAGGIPVTWVVNKMNPGVNMREVLRFISIKDPVFIPALPAEKLYAAEYACRTLAGEAAFQKAIEQLFPDN